MSATSNEVSNPLQPVQPETVVRRRRGMRRPSRREARNRRSRPRANLYRPTRSSGSSAVEAGSTTSTPNQKVALPWAPLSPSSVTWTSSAWRPGSVGATRTIGSSNVSDARSPSIVRNWAFMDVTGPSSSISEPPGNSMNLLTGGYDAKSAIRSHTRPTRHTTCTRSALPIDRCRRKPACPLGRSSRRTTGPRMSHLPRQPARCEMQL